MFSSVVVGGKKKCREREGRCCSVTFSPSSAVRVIHATSKVAVPFASVCFLCVCVLWFRQSERLKTSVVFTESGSVVTQVVEEDEEEEEREEEDAAAV